MPNAIAQYWQLEKLQFKSRRFMISLLIQALLWVLVAFTNLLPGFMDTPKDASALEALGTGMAGLVPEMSFAGIALLFFITEQIGFWQKGIFRRYLIDGFTRADILGYQLLSLGLRFLISVILGLLVYVALGFVMIPSVIPEVLGAVDWTFLLFLTAGFVAKGLLVLLLINLIQKFYVILAFMGWMLLENILGNWKPELHDWLPYELADRITDMAQGSTWHWYHPVWLGAIMVGVIFGLLTLARKRAY